MTSKYLIINADDYGYYACVSKGILEGAESGSITATSIMANSPYFDEHIDWLKKADKLDKGVHLNISHGNPLSENLSHYLAQWQGAFPNKLAIVQALLTRKIPIAEIEYEWRCQIERCLSSDIEITFLNSHEHLHMLPPFNRIFNRLVNDYNLPYSRISIPEWQIPISKGSLFRNILLAIMNLFNSQHYVDKSPSLLGINESGNLNLLYLTKIFKSLNPGMVYELMCHPGYFDSNEITDPNLLSYHNWTGELNLLLSDKFKNLCVSEGIELINYRQLAELNLK